MEGREGMGRIKSGLSAGNVIAALALFVALGGGAYAAVNAGTQTITVCVHKQNGGLYKAAKCASGDTSLSWNKVGPRGLQGPRGLPGHNGTTIVARARSTGPVTAATTPQSDPLTGGTWTQGATQLDTFAGQATVQEPAASDCAGQGFNTMSGTVSMNGTPVGSFSALSFSGGAQTITTPISFTGSVFEPGTATQRSLTVTVSDNCTGSAHFVLQSVAIDVEGAS
jgi:hypothetical protein